MGWGLIHGMSTDDPTDSEQAKQTTLGAWEMAVENRNMEEGLIFHSDRFFQYVNKKFVNVLDSSKKITRSI